MNDLKDGGGHLYGTLRLKNVYAHHKCYQALFKLITLAVIKWLCASIDAEAGRTPISKKKLLATVSNHIHFGKAHF
jgi:hypothetical protein